MQLVDGKTKQPLAIGDTVTTFRGEVGKLVSIELPRTPESTGRVNVKFENLEHVQRFYPSVVGAEWSGRNE